MIIKTNDEKMVTLYKKTYGDGILTESQIIEQAIDDMNNAYMDILGSTIPGNELEDYLKPKAFEQAKKVYVDEYMDENVEPYEVPAYELLAEVIKVLSPEEVEKFARSARS